MNGNGNGQRWRSLEIASHKLPLSIPGLIQIFVLLAIWTLNCTAPFWWQRICWCWSAWEVGVAWNLAWLRTPTVLLPHCSLMCSALGPRKMRLRHPLGHRGWSTALPSIWETWMNLSGWRGLGSGVAHEPVAPDSSSDRCLILLCFLACICLPGCALALYCLSCSSLIVLS